MLHMRFPMKLAVRTRRDKKKRKKDGKKKEKEKEKRIEKEEKYRVGVRFESPRRSIKLSWLRSKG